MKKEYCKPILEAISFESNQNVALLEVSQLNGNDVQGESFNDINWE